MPEYKEVDLTSKYKEVEVKPGAMRVPALDPLTGRTQMPGHTMSQKETLDYGLATIPTAAAFAATLPISGPTGAAATGLGALFRVAVVRSLAAAGGGAAGSLIESGLQSGLDTPKAPKGAADVINRAVENAAVQGMGQGVAEGIGWLGPVSVAGLKKVAGGLPKTHGGMQYMRGKWDDIKRATDARKLDMDETASLAVQDFRAAVQPHEVGEITQDAATLMQKRFVAKETTGFGKMEEALRGTPVDYRDVADRLIALEKKRPKATGGLSEMTKPSTEWADLVKAMESGQRPKIIPKDKGAMQIEEVGGGIRQAARPGRFEFGLPENALGDGAAVVRARSTISQRLWDLDHGGAKLAGGETREYVEGLRDLLKTMDSKIIGAANSVDPLLGEGYRELLKFSGANREIMKSALFEMARDNKGDVAKVLLSSRHPENVNIFMEIAKGGKLKPDDVAAVQRAGVESMLTRTKGVEKVIDLESFLPRFQQTGEAGKRLFADPKAKGLIDRLSELSREVRTLPKKPGDVGITLAEANENKMMELVAASAAYQKTGMIFLPRELYRVGTKWLMKVADNPQTYKKFHTVWRGYQKGGMTTQDAAKQLTNLVRLGELGITASDMWDQEGLAPAH